MINYNYSTMPRPPWARGARSLFRWMHAQRLNLVIARTQLMHRNKYEPNYAHNVCTEARRSISKYVDVVPSEWARGSQPAASPDGLWYRPSSNNDLAVLACINCTYRTVSNALTYTYVANQQ